MKNMKILLSLFIGAFLFGCDQTDAAAEAQEEKQEVSNATAEPTLFGKWRLTNFEIDGKLKFDECDAQTVWNFTDEVTGMHEGKKLYVLEAKAEDPSCRLYGFTAEWDELSEGENSFFVSNFKVGKGTNKSGNAQIEKLTTTHMVLSLGTWVYSFER